MSHPPTTLPDEWLDTDAEAAKYRKMREAMPANRGSRWLMLIKELRCVHQCSIEEAQDHALGDPAWRRWVERQINANEQCARLARKYIHARKQTSQIVRVGTKFKVLARKP